MSVDRHKDNIHARYQIFDETREFKFDLLAKRLRELAFLNPGVKISLKEDKQKGKKTLFSKMELVNM